MRLHRNPPKSGCDSVSQSDLRKGLARIRAVGALSIRDMDDDVLVDKDHAWASRKPSKRALQLAFMAGRLVVSERLGMLKTYELMDRHFQWDTPAKKASPKQTVDYWRSEEHTSELQSLMRISYAVFCLKKTLTHKKGQT